MIGDGRGPVPHADEPRARVERAPTCYGCGEEWTGDPERKCDACEAVEKALLAEYLRLPIAGGGGR